MSTRKPNILFLDDEQHVLDGIKRKIRKEINLWHVSFMNDSLQAREKILKEKFDVVISDIRMPGLDGISLLKTVKQTSGLHSPEFIILTGADEKDLKRRALDLDAADMLNKPVEKEDLLARIKNAIRLKQAKDEILKKNKLLEEQLFQSQKMETIGMMASGAAHDFNNVLAAILTSLELAEIKYGADAALIQDIHKIQKMAEHGKHITEQILRFVKKKKIVKEAVALNQIVKEVLEVVRTTIPKMISVNWEKPAQDIVIQADYTQVFQMILNLCLNASKAMRGGGSLSIALYAEKIIEGTLFLGKKIKPGTYACIVVSDTGPGMDENLIRNLMENPVSVKPSASGTGLGLSIVTRMLINHSGFFKIDSSKTKGTAFKLFLPLPIEGRNE